MRPRIRFPFSLYSDVLDLGEHERAEAYFQQWPETDQGHLYWKWRAIIQDEFGNAHEDACKAYERALEIWPGPINWGLRHRKAVCLAKIGNEQLAALRHRKAVCLAKIGNEQLAAEERKRVIEVKQLMDVDTHERLRKALGSIQELEKSGIVGFYRQLGRNREADCWMEQIQRLRADPSHKAVPHNTRSP